MNNCPVCGTLITPFDDGKCPNKEYHKGRLEALKEVIKKWRYFKSDFEFNNWLNGQSKELEKK